MTRPIGVYLSESIDLAAYIGEQFRTHAPGLDMRRPEEVDDPDAVRFAVAWEPPAGSFAPYRNLVLVSSIAAGVDNILHCPGLPDVPVVRIRDAEQARIMAGFVTWHVLWWERKFALHLANQASATWERLSARPPSRCRIGILGFGSMAQATARTLISLGHPVAAHARSATHAGAIEGVELLHGPGSHLALAARSDILVNLLPLTDETRGILSAELFATLPDGAVLIQVGRGEHLDEAALLAALDGGRLAGASLDVFTKEPLPRDHPFWRHPKIVVTSHDAAEANFAITAEQVAEQVRRALAGLPLIDPVARDRGY